MEKRELPKVFALTIYNYGFLKIHVYIGYILLENLSSEFKII